MLDRIVIKMLGTEKWIKKEKGGGAGKMVLDGKKNLTIHPQRR